MSVLAMRRSVAVFLVALALSAVSLSQACDGPTACVGPVRLDFDNTTCHGVPETYYQVSTSETANCVAVGLLWSKSQCVFESGVQWVQVTTYDDSSCSQLNSIDFFSSGECFYEGSGMASVWLCDVNDTITTQPSEGNPELPIFDSQPTMCENPENCPISDETIKNQTYYEDQSCTIPYTSTYNNRTQNYTFNACLYDQDLTSNILLTCDPEYFSMVYYQAYDCAALPYRINRQKRSCARVRASAKRHMQTVDGLQLTSGVAASYHRINCPGISEAPLDVPFSAPSEAPTDVPSGSPFLAPSTPIAPVTTAPTPASDASRLYSAIFMILTIVAGYMML